MDPINNNHGAWVFPGAGPGATLLDQFAMVALQGLLAFSPGDSGVNGQYTPDRAATLAYNFAEAMMTERASRESGR